MAWYSRRKTQLTRQIISDAFVAVWTIVWFAVSRAIDGAIRAIAAPLRTTADQAGKVADQVGEAGSNVENVPGIGGILGRPLSGASDSLDQISAAIEQQAAAVETAATVTGLITFAVPFLIVLAVWLPIRLRYVRNSAAAQRLVDSGEATDLLALRALTTQPIRKLRAISDDPVRAWRHRDPECLDRLAGLEIHRLGLRGSDPTQPPNSLGPL